VEIECRKNIEELHIFIETWLKGSADKSKPIFQHFEDELDDDFVIIHPSGEVQDKSNIISDFWNAHGVQPNNFSIQIRNIKVRSESQDICTLNYEEWQTGVDTTVRISTVIFRKSKISGKNNWFHLHETWRPNK